MCVLQRVPGPVRPWFTSSRTLGSQYFGKCWIGNLRAPGLEVRIWPAGVHGNEACVYLQVRPPCGNGERTFLLLCQVSQPWLSIVFLFSLALSANAHPEENSLSFFFLLIFSNYQAFVSFLPTSSPAPTHIHSEKEEIKPLYQICLVKENRFLHWPCSTHFLSLYQIPLLSFFRHACFY